MKGGSRWRRICIIKRCFFVSAIFLLFSSIASAQGCQTCDQPPQELQKYFDVIDKLLDALQVNQPNLNTSNQFAQDGKEIIFAVKAGVQSAAMTVMLSLILPAHTVFFDTRGEVKTLASNESRRRDREFLTQIDRKIMIKALAIAKNGYMGKKVPKQLLENSDTIIQQLWYVEFNKANLGSYVMFLQGVTYDELLGVYRHLNNVYKTLHRAWRYRTDLADIGSEYQLVDSNEKQEVIKKAEREPLQRFLSKIEHLVASTFDETNQELRWPLNMRLNFKDDYIKFATTVREIQQAYDCSTWPKDVCNTTWTDTVNSSRENTKGRVHKDLTSVKKTFTLALSRLKGALRSKNPKYKKAANQREAALLNSIYWGDIPPERKWFVNDNSEVENPEWVPGIVSDNPYMDNGANFWAKIKLKASTEELAVDTQTLVKQIEDSQRLCQQDPSVDCSNDLYYGATRSQVPQAADQDNPNKYADQGSKEAALQEYKPDLKQTRRNDQEIDTRGILADQMSKNQIDAVKNVFVSVLQLQTEKQVESVFLETKRVTKQFPVLSAAVYRNIDLRGKKNEPGNTQAATIYNSMGKICELQCTNLQGRCRYYTD